MKSGVYQIINTINNKRYIGSTNNLKKRFKEHKDSLLKGNHSNNHLQRAWNKYGEENFIFETIENCELSALIEREQYFTDLCNPEYAIRRECVASNLGVALSKETRQRMSEAQKGKVPWNAGIKTKPHSTESRLKISRSLMGRHVEGHIHSVETRKKISKSHMGLKHSEETKRKMSVAHKGKRKTIEHRLKIAAAAKERYKNKDNHPRGMKGKIHSAETKEKIRESFINRRLKWE